MEDRRRDESNILVFIFGAGYNIGVGWRGSGR